MRDPHWRMIQTRSRSTVMRVILLLAKAAEPRLSWAPKP
jgi:hypothetical protein